MNIKNNANQPPAVVLNLSRNGLGVIRSLGTRGIPVFGADRSLNRPGARSRYCQAFRCPDPSQDEKGLLAFLQELGGKLGQKAVVFPTSDDYVRFLSKYRLELADLFSPALASAQAIDLTVDKRRTYEAARRLGIPTPAFGFAQDQASLKNLSEQMPYPALIKPVMSQAGPRPIAGKVVQVESADELLNFYHHLDAPWPSVLVQEMIPGGDDALWTLGAYLDANIRPLAIFCGRKLRQFPPHFGTCSLGECRWDLEVVKSGLRLLKGIDYSGPTQVEFKLDPRDGQFKLIEINARTWLWHSLATDGKVDLAYVAYLDLASLPVDRYVLGQPEARWLSLIADVSSARRYVRRGELAWGAWLRSLRGVRKLDILSLRDPLPFITTLWNVTRYKMKAME